MKKLQNQETPKDLKWEDSALRNPATEHRFQRGATPDRCGICGLPHKDGNPNDRELMKRLLPQEARHGGKDQRQ